MAAVGASCLFSVGQNGKRRTEHDSSAPFPVVDHEAARTKRVGRLLTLDGPIRHQAENDHDQKCELDDAEDAY
jgi:hypothetical protein